MASSRFPGKPLADIGGTPMIVHVWKRAIEADVGPVWVTCPDQEIADAIKDSGGNAILTHNEHISGSDRVHEAVCLLESTADIIINLQGDCPFIKPKSIRSVLTPLKTKAVDKATLAAENTDNENKPIVKKMPAPPSISMFCCENIKNQLKLLKKYLKST